MKTLVYFDSPESLYVILYAVNPNRNSVQENSADPRRSQWREFWVYTEHAGDYYFTRDPASAQSTTTTWSRRWASISLDSLKLDRFDCYDLVLTARPLEPMTGEEWRNLEEWLAQSPRHRAIISEQRNHDLELNRQQVWVAPEFNLYYAYYTLGFFWLNYTKIPKQTLIGAYAGQDYRYKPWRWNLLQALKSHFDITFLTHRTTAPIYQDLNYQRNYIAGYTDYATTVASVIMETITGREDHLYFSEKTLKSILFQQAGTDFIYVHSDRAMQWLTDRGFSYLNCNYWNRKADLQLQDHMLITPRQFVRSRSYQSAVISGLELCEQERQAKGDLEALRHYLDCQRPNRRDQNYRALNHLLQHCEYSSWLL